MQVRLSGLRNNTARNWWMPSIRSNGL
ncbi:unnamed protein product [Acanthoscelides obtectus]|uniref:Uncharacterized protein n=1 Tax=Acanthoscelides obtectus TaxID=200917 RepID=A0A9P0PU45_ACAOB|nr:unnamed protein product [Acanthoscelides obtectus]CAK1624377.1 hypothetical protein AOBTE_LOCUS2530 [Acanthoscelides obtectus]